MTPRQLETLRAIDRLSRQWGFAPTFGELAAELRTNSNSFVPNAIKALEAAGLVTRRADKSWRSLIVTDLGLGLLAVVSKAPPEAQR